MARSVRINADGSETELADVEIPWERVRYLRDKELALCDWRALKDVVLSTAWKEYRSALRDLPSDNATTDECFENWPVAPDE
jgi:hypothetical protein